MATSAGPFNVAGIGLGLDAVAAAARLFQLPASTKPPARHVVMGFRDLGVSGFRGARSPLVIGNWSLVIHRSAFGFRLSAFRFPLWNKPPAYGKRLAM